MKMKSTDIKHKHEEKDNKLKELESYYKKQTE